MKWLPIEDNLKFSLAKLAHQGIYDENQPNHLKLQIKTTNKNLRRSVRSEMQIEVQRDNIFQENVATIFNDLPEELRKIESFNLFKSKCFNYLKDVAIARTLDQQ